MEGFDRSTYGDAFADVYDGWYGDLPDLDRCVAVLAELAAGRPVLELGVGTGRVARPLAAAGAGPVVGIDPSGRMLERLVTHPVPPGDARGRALRAVGADAAALPFRPRTFGLVFAAYNTFWSLGDESVQRSALAEAARCATADGLLVLEGIAAPTDPDRPSSSVEVSRLSVDEVVLLVAKEDAGTQTLAGQHVVLSERGVRLRPWRIRYHTDEQLDALARGTGWSLVHRWSGWGRERATPDDPATVAVYERRPAGPGGAPG